MNNIIERLKMVKAMEFIARCINNEEIFWNYWAIEGVADGDIEFGNLEVNTEKVEEDDAYFYTNDESFSELMKLFLDCMVRARRDGGLYCGEISSAPVEVKKKENINNYWEAVTAKYPDAVFDFWYSAGELHFYKSLEDKRNGADVCSCLKTDGVYVFKEDF